MKEDPVQAMKRIADDPILVEMSKVLVAATGLKFMVVFPHEGGWAQVMPGHDADHPDFCQLVHASKQGARRCRMCHVLMSIAVSNGEIAEQKCHAGVSVIVAPIDLGGGETASVMSSCHFTSDWPEVKHRGQALKLNLPGLKKAYEQLVHIDKDKLELARMILNAAGKAVVEVRRRWSLMEQLDELKRKRGLEETVAASVERRLKTSGRERKKARRKSKGQKGHPLVDVVIELIDGKPAMPFSVFEISAAARMTPNHFSALFKKQVGTSFSEYLSNRRLELAKKLLKDLTLNVSEVAKLAGYEDPGYFARRFKQKEKISPREWRKRPR